MPSDTKVNSNYENCANLWKYCGKTFTTCKHSLNALTKIPSRQALGIGNLDTKILAITTRLKIISVVGVVFDAPAIPSTYQKIINSSVKGDKEGVALNTLSLAVVTCDVVDTLSTFINAALSAASKAPINALTLLNYPIAFVLLGIGSMLRMVTVVKTHCLMRKFQMEVKNKCQTSAKQDFTATSETLRRFIETHLGIKANSAETTLTSDPVKKENFLRAASPEIAAEFENVILAILNDTTESDESRLKKINTSLEKISGLLESKLSSESFNLTAGLVYATGFCLLFSSLHPALPYLLFASSTVMKLSFIAYQDMFRQQSP